MDKVSFVQWVPQSELKAKKNLRKNFHFQCPLLGDVVVAQSDFNLAIWYNIDVPQHVTMVSIRGEVMQVIREEVRTATFDSVSKPIFKVIFRVQLR